MEDMKRVQTEEIIVTNHAMMRLRERPGIRRKSVGRILPKVIENGKDLDEEKGYLGLWARKKSSNGGKKVLYGEYIYIFDENRLLTVMRAPSKENVIHLMDGHRVKKEKSHGIDLAA